MSVWFYIRCLIACILFGLGSIMLTGIIGPLLSEDAWMPWSDRLFCLIVGALCFALAYLIVA